MTKDGWISHHELLDAIHELRKDLKHDYRRIMENLMSLDQSVSDAISAQADALKTLATDLGTFEQNAQSAQDRLQAAVDDLTAGHTIDQAKIDALQAAADAMDRNVVQALSPLTDAVRQMDAQIQPIVPPAP